MTIALRGYVVDQLGVAKNGVTVEAWWHDGVAAASSTTSDATGVWAFAALDEAKQWRIKLVDGLKVLWIDGRSRIQITNMDVITSISTNTIAEHTATSGVTIDGVLLKDNFIVYTAIPGVKSLWAQPQYVVGAGSVLASICGNYPATALANNADNIVGFSIPIPSDFHALSKAVVVLIPVAGNNIYRAVTTYFATTGQDKDTHTDAIAVGAVAVTADFMFDDDISAAFTGIAAGDRVGITWLRNAVELLDTSEGIVYILGLLIEYT